MVKPGFVFATLALALGLVACGSAPDSTFEDPNKPADMPNGVPTGSNLGEIGPRGTGSACVNQVASANAYARQVAAERPNEKAAVVLVSDGEPGFWDASANAFVPGCVDNDVTHAADAAKTAFEGSKIPTYVIGVGPKLDALNGIAAAG